MVVTVGFFDGVHIGHRRVLRSLVEKGGDAAAVVTFWPHPRIVLGQNAEGLSLLTSFQEKEAMLHDCHISDVRCVEFTPEFASMDAESFIKEYLIGQIGCTSLVLGYDNRFGSDGLDTVQIAQLCRGMGITVEVVPPCIVDGFSVSSTRIRNSLKDGDVALAARMLGYHYRIDGVASEGSDGKRSGFRTILVTPCFAQKAVPREGVYATDVFIQGSRYRGMTFIDNKIYTHIFDYAGTVPDDGISLEFISRVRGVQHFESDEEMRSTLEMDKHRCFG